MKKLIVVLLFVMGTLLHAQDIPAGVKMGMTYAQIKPLMTNGEWRSSNSEGIFYVFFQKSEPPAIYSFGIDSNKGLVSLEINIIDTSVADVVKKLSSKYGTPVFSDDSYIWGLDGDPSNDIFAISVRRSEAADTFTEVRYIFLNALNL